MTETTLIIFKPDSLRRGLVGTILKRFEDKGLTIVHLRLTNLPMNIIEDHYKEHYGTEYYEKLVSFLYSGDVIIGVFRGENAIQEVRKMVGSASMEKRLPGTIRGDFSLSTNENLIHSSDSKESFDREFKIFSKYFFNNYD